MSARRPEVPPGFPLPGFPPPGYPPPGYPPPGFPQPGFPPPSFTPPFEYTATLTPPTRMVYAGADYLLLEGRDLTHVQQVLGHVSISTTQVYEELAEQMRAPSDSAALPVVVVADADD